MANVQDSNILEHRTPTPDSSLREMCKRLNSEFDKLKSTIKATQELAKN